MNWLGLYCETYDRTTLKKQGETCRAYYLAKIGNEASEKIYRQHIYTIPEIPKFSVPMFLPAHHKRMLQYANEYIAHNIHDKKDDLKLFTFEIMRDMINNFSNREFGSGTAIFETIELLNNISFSALSPSTYGSPEIRILYHKYRYLALWSCTYDALIDMSEYYTPEIKEDQKHCFISVFGPEELFPEKFKKTSSLPAGAYFIKGDFL